MREFNSIWGETHRYDVYKREGKGKRNLYQKLILEVPPLSGEGVYFLRYYNLYNFDMENKGSWYVEFPEDETIKDDKEAEEKALNYIKLF